MGETRRPRRVIGALALALGIVAGGLATAVTASPAAAACSLTPTGGTVTKTVSGLRSYNLRVPAGLTGNAPLLLSIHGFQSFPFGQEFQTGWSQVADQQKFIVAYPAGNWNTWNYAQNSPDVAFLRELVAHIRSQYCVDADRIYAEGGSFGGFMAQRLACDADDLFAAIATTISGPISPCTLGRPIAMSIVNSENDPIFPLATSAVPNRNQWIARNGCSTTPTADPNPYGLNGAVYGGCNGGVHVLWRTYTGLGHGYPTGAALADFQSHVWSFLLAHPMP